MEIVMGRLCHAYNFLFLNITSVGKNFITLTANAKLARPPDYIGDISMHFFNSLSLTKNENGNPNNEPKWYLISASVNRTTNETSIYQRSNEG